MEGAGQRIYCYAEGDFTAVDVAHGRADGARVSRIRRGCSRADPGANFQWGEAGEYSADSRGYHAGNERALLRWRGDDRTATHDRCDRQTISGANAGTC